SPRVLRNFMRDRPMQLVLGVFLGIFAYCLVVLRTIRGEGELAFIPSVAVLAGMAYALAGIALLIFFIHHVAQGIQAASIIGRIADDTSSAVDHLFPRDVGEPAGAAGRPADLPRRWTEVPAAGTGYVVSVDGEGLLGIARDRGRVVRLRVGVGDFVTEGSGLLDLAGTDPVEEGEAGRLRRCVVLGPQRTVEQDAAFGFQQLVDVALKALSPGINDPTTACMAIDRLGGLLGRLASRRMPDGQRMQDGRLLVVLQVPRFPDLALEALEPVLQHCRGDVQVLQRLAAALATVEQRTGDPARRQPMQVFARELARAVRRLPPSRRRKPLLEAARSLERSLGGRAARGVPGADADR
ncbi:MAG: DUF2254 domain-containing protein, partial [Comamonadaceae bacterium]